MARAPRRLPFAVRAFETKHALAIFLDNHLVDGTFETDVQIVRGSLVNWLFCFRARTFNKNTMFLDTKRAPSYMFHQLVMGLPRISSRALPAVRTDNHILPQISMFSYAYTYTHGEMWESAQTYKIFLEPLRCSSLHPTASDILFAIKIRFGSQFRMEFKTCHYLWESPEKVPAQVRLKQPHTLHWPVRSVPQ